MAWFTWTNEATNAGINKIQIEPTYSYERVIGSYVDATGTAMELTESVAGQRFKFTNMTKASTISAVSELTTTYKDIGGKVSASWNGNGSWDVEVNVYTSVITEAAIT